MAVRCHDDIAVGSHHLEVPAVAPELADRTLWTSLTEEQGGVFLSLLIIGGQYYPYQFLLAVGGRNPTLHDLTEVQLVEDMFVLKRDLFDVTLHDVVCLKVSHPTVVLPLGKG